MSSITQTICPLKQFENETGFILARGERQGCEVLPWEGITREQIDTLIESFQTGQGQGGNSGSFHSWCIHKKNKKLYDDYSNPSTNLGSIVQDIMKLHNCDKLIYEEFEKTPKYLERLHATENEKYKNWSWYPDYKAAQDWSTEGYCFQRAHMKHKENKNWKIKFGMVWIENSKTGKRWLIEGNKEQNGQLEDGFIEIHIQLLKNKVRRGLMSKNRAKELIFFFTTKSRDMIEYIIDSWKQPAKVMVHKRDVSRKHHARQMTKK